MPLINRFITSSRKISYKFAESDQALTSRDVFYRGSSLISATAHYGTFSYVKLGHLDNRSIPLPSVVCSYVFIAWNFRDLFFPFNIVISLWPKWRQIFLSEHTSVIIKAYYLEFILNNKISYNKIKNHFWPRWPCSVRPFRLRFLNKRDWT